MKKRILSLLLAFVCLACLLSPAASATTLSPKKSCTVEQSILLVYRVFTAC